MPGEITSWDWLIFTVRAITCSWSTPMSGEESKFKKLSSPPASPSPSPFQSRFPRGDHCQVSGVSFQKWYLQVTRVLCFDTNITGLVMLLGPRIFIEQHVADLFRSTRMEPSFHFLQLLLLQEEHTMAHGSTNLFCKDLIL